MKITGKFLFGLIFFAGLLFLTISFVSWTPEDSALNGVFPAADIVHNRLGTLGDSLASLCFNSFGWATWFLPVFALYSFAFYWTKNGLQQPILKTTGFFLILAGLAGALPLVLPESTPGTLTGAGGRLGALFQILFEGRLARLGQFIFLASMVFAGIILAFDSFLLRVSLWLTGIGVISEILTAPFRRRKRKPLTDPNITENNDSDAFGNTIDNTTDNGTNRQPLPSRLNAAFYNKKTSSQKMQLKEKPVFNESNNENPSEYEDDESDLGDTNTDTYASEPVPHYNLPDIDLLLPAEEMEENPEDDLERRSHMLKKAFEYFNLSIKVLGTQTGPVLTLFEVALAPGTRINQIRALEDDLAIIMKATRVRVVAPLPGKNTIGIEIPNANRQLVHLRELIEADPDRASKLQIPVFLGRDVIGTPMVVDLTKMPHLLIAGQTGTGKSVCLNSIIMSILMTRTPEQVQLILIDPKMVELSLYRTIPHLMHPVVVDMKKAEAILAWAVNKMEERYAVMARIGVRQISEYNALNLAALKRRAKPVNEADWDSIPRKMPHIVVIADEMADLMMTSGKEVESLITRLAQKSRAVGIHLVLATQKPTVDIITGLIKSNLPARIAFGVSTRVDSMVILDSKGAEQLLGYGDMLFLPPGTNQLVRGQGTFVSNEEIESVISEIGTEQPNYVIDEKDLEVSSEDEMKGIRDELAKQRDELYADCVEAIFTQGSASTSFLQRRFKIGYGRAARIIDDMTTDGIISQTDPQKPSQPHKILITRSQWLEMGNKKGKAQETKIPDIVPFKKDPTPLFEGRTTTRSNSIIESVEEPDEELDEELDEETDEEPAFEEMTEEDSNEEYDEEGDEYEETGDEEETDDEYAGEEEVGDEEYSDEEYGDEEYDETEEEGDEEYVDENEEPDEGMDETPEEEATDPDNIFPDAPVPKKKRKGFTDEDWDNYLNEWDK